MDLHLPPLANIKDAKLIPYLFALRMNLLVIEILGFIIYFVVYNYILVNKFTEEVCIEKF